MRVRYVTSTEHRGPGRSWYWLPALAVAVVAALVLPWLATRGPQVVVYPTSDFTRLPVGTSMADPAGAASCVSIQHPTGSPKLVDHPCGSAVSTFRVIGRVDDVSQCVRDADLTYSWTSGPKSGAVCLDYDWTADQCLQISKSSAAKVDCDAQGALLPDTAVIGAVDVSYCREGGIAHSVRHFTVCTLSGKNCKGRTRGS